MTLRPYSIGIGLQAGRTAQQLASEKQAEEQQIRRDWETQIQAAEAASKQQFEADLAAKKAAAQASFDAQLTSAKTQADFDAAWTEKERSLRSSFGSEISAERTRAKQLYQQGVQSRKAVFRESLGEAMTRAKIEAAISKRSYAGVAPRLLSSYEKSEKQVFAEALGAEAEVMETKLTDWETSQAASFEAGLTESKVASQTEYEKGLVQWETEQKAAFEKQMADYETQAREIFVKGGVVEGAEVKGISTWKAEETTKLETSISKWSEQWQPKGAGERILDWTAGIQKPFDWQVPLLTIPTEKGAMQIGLDVGKFFQGLAKGTGVAAAGIVGTGERLVYGVAEVSGMIGGFKVTTPRALPTVSGAGISSVIQSVTSGQAQWSQEALSLGEPLISRGLGEFQFTYGASTVLGDLMISYGAGKVAEKLIIQPLAQTRLGQYVGYQFKLHAPKPILRLAYGKSGAEYIVTERSPFYEGAIEGISPTGEAMQTTWKIPKSVEETVMSREILGGKESEFKVWTSSGYKSMTTEISSAADFPLLRFRGQRITPMSKTLARAMGKLGEEKGVTTLLAPLQTIERVVHPALPAIAAELQFGVTPLTEALPTAISLSAALGVQQISRVKAKALETPALKQPTRLKKGEMTIHSLAEITGLKSWQVVSPMLSPVQSVSQAVAQVQSLKLVQRLKLRRLQLGEMLPKKKLLRLPKKATKRMAGYLYPVLPERRVPKYLGAGLGLRLDRRQSKPISASSFLFGKRRNQNVFKQNKKSR